MSYIAGKGKNQLLEELKSTAQVGSQIHEQEKAEIMVRSVEDIEKAVLGLAEQLKNNAQSSDQLGRKVFWLNVILALATLLGAFATVVMAIKS